MQLADSSLLSDLQLPSIADLQSGLNYLTPTVATPTVGAPSAGAQSASSSDFWTNALNTIGNIGTAGLQVFGAIKQAQYLQQAGINPVGYSASGMPVYGSTPAGVTPSNPYSLPSGMALPAGVSPTGGYAVTPGATTVSTSFVNPLANLLSGNTGMYLMLGGTAIFMLLALKRKGR